MSPKKKELLINSIVALVAGAVIFLLVFFLYGSDNHIYARLSNSFFIPGVCLVGMSLMVLIVRRGTFDLMNYGIMSFFNSFRSQEQYDRRFVDFNSYRESKEQKRKYTSFNLLPYLILGAILLVIALSFTISYQYAI